jgi:hypothetical protein
MEAESYGEEILRKMKESDLLYHRLTLVVGPPGSGNHHQESVRRTGH